VRAGQPHNADPAPGSDEINRAYEEGWVGNRALAFIGDTLAINGDKVPELFIVELPEASRAGSSLAMRRWQERKPRCRRRLPALFSRLTFTHQRRYPGLVNAARHWVRANPGQRRLLF
jgi:hypothetical protein